jgi:hypothetical protein
VKGELGVLILLHLILVACAQLDDGQALGNGKHDLLVPLILCIQTGSISDKLLISLKETGN